MEKARGGVLFVDEAYMVNTVGGYGEEAVTALLSHMEPEGSQPPTCVTYITTLSDFCTLTRCSYA